MGTILSLLVTLFWLLLIPVTLFKLADGSLFLAPDLGQVGGQPRVGPRAKSVATTRKYIYTASRRSFSLSPSPLRGRRSRSRVSEKSSQREQSNETRVVGDD